MKLLVKIIFTKAKGTIAALSNSLFHCLFPRGVNIRKLHFCDLSHCTTSSLSDGLWEDDLIRVLVTESKNNGDGSVQTVHFARHLDPIMCPVLALSIVLILRIDLRFNFAKQ